MAMFDILANEIKLWKDFEYALREESALLFGKMLSECGQNKDQHQSRLFSKGEHHSAESLFMLLILRQQKMINELIAKVSECKKLQRQIQ